MKVSFQTLITHLYTCILYKNSYESVIPDVNTFIYMYFI